MAGKFDLGAILAGQEVKTPPKPRDIAAITAEIIENKRRGGEAVLTIGRALNEAKALLSHGEWLPWLTEQAELSERAAQNFMRLAREWSNPQTLADLGSSKALALLALPEEEREQFVEAHPVADMSTRELKQAIADREAALAEKAAANKERDKLAERVAALQSAQELAADLTAQKDAEIVQLRAELKATQERPVDVAVMEVDQTALDAARAEAAAAAQAKLDKALDGKKQAEEKRKALEEELTALRAQLADSAREDKRAQIAADKDLAVFEVTFAQTQEDVNRLHGLLMKVRSRGDETLAEKLRRALLALADSVRGCAG